jgi:hypothetical protein
VIIFENITHIDVKIRVNFIQSLHYLSVLFYETHRRCDFIHKIYMDRPRDRMSDIDDQRFDQLQVSGAQLMELIEVFFDSDPRCSGRTNATIHQKMNRTINRPRLEVMLPDVMMLPLFVRRWAQLVRFLLDDPGTELAQGCQP